MWGHLQGTEGLNLRGGGGSGGNPGSGGGEQGLHHTEVQHVRKFLSLVIVWKHSHTHDLSQAITRLSPLPTRSSPRAAQT